MYNFLLILHSVLRWVIILLLVVNILRFLSATVTNKVALSKWLLIAAHATLLIGLYQYFAGGSGFALIQQYGMGEAMKDSAKRFWAVEHITGMIISIALITVGHISLKKSGNSKRSAILYILALAIILATVPWPFREGIGRPWLPGM
ncbi:hypothetical protein [Limnovirga soli]|uniref:Cytochrome B n=1 Tax=Limnovirga soli TaxID=2656915 RepID=A0A8J8FI39_9BACT|nr:hypothetical protein [Limnovirga soli]NNV58015.1 hypothetical protein [Limnovirga soli]